MFEFIRTTKDEKSALQSESMLKLHLVAYGETYTFELDNNQINAVWSKLFTNDTGDLDALMKAIPTGEG